MIQSLSYQVADKSQDIPDTWNSMSLSARWIDSVRELEDLTSQWDLLLENSLWKNLSYLPNILIPAFQHLNQDNARVLVIEATRSDSNHDQPKLLCGLMPIVTKRCYQMPIRGAELWKHAQCFDTTPILRREIAELTLGHAFEFLANEKISLLSLDTVSAEPGFAQALDQAIEKHKLGRFQRDSFARAALQPLEDVDEYMKRYVSKSIKRNLRRLARRLEDEGTVTFELAGHDADYEQLAQEFLEIESSGWKGESGTALVCNPSEKAFYEEAISRAAANGQARFLTLRLDGKAIAMLSDFEFNGVIYSYKTAFDDAYSAFSPGLQLEVKNIEFMHEQQITIADSCASPDNSTINRIWGQELKFQNVVIGLRPGIPQFAIRMMPWIQAASRKAKSLRNKKSS